MQPLSEKLQICLLHINSDRRVDCRYVHVCRSGGAVNAFSNSVSPTIGGGEKPLYFKPVRARGSAARTKEKFQIFNRCGRCSN